ncbi:MAG: VOC family protein [Firmicutes bacterium]|nr:VOC family protein [Bacillota bacterium]
MRIDHIAVYVQNLERTKEYYVNYFGAVSNALYHNPKTGLQTYFLSFEDGCRLEIMQRPDVPASAETGEQIGYTHLSFSTGSREAVDTLTKRLREDGYAVLSGPRVTGDGYYESQVSDPDGNRVELVA